MKKKVALSPIDDISEPKVQPSSKKRKLIAGEISVQSFKHYLLDTQLLAYRLKKQTVIPIVVKASGFYMLLMLYGESVFMDAAGVVISRAYTNSGSIGYIKAGAYKRMLPKGLHKLMILSFRSEWFKWKVKQMDTFKPLIDGFEADQGCCVLPNCAVANSFFKVFTKLKLQMNNADGDVAVIDFLSHTVDRYQ